MEPGVVFLALAGPLVVLGSELLYAGLWGRRYLLARAEAEQLVAQARSAASRRSLQRILSRLSVLRVELRRLLVARLALLLAGYSAAAVIAALYPEPLVRIACCIPLLSIESGGACYTTPAVVVAASFLAAMPVLSTDAVVIAVAGRR